MIKVFINMARNVGIFLISISLFVMILFSFFVSSFLLAIKLVEVNGNIHLLEEIIQPILFLFAGGFSLLGLSFILYILLNIHNKSKERRELKKDEYWQKMAETIKQEVKKRKIKFEGINSKGIYVGDKTGQMDNMLVIFRKKEVNKKK